MDFPRIVIGYHGCSDTFAQRLLSGKLPFSEWNHSQNPWDWLGHGIYFWEHSPVRAMRWGRERRRWRRFGIVGALIQLGRCFDLTDIANTESLSVGYERLVENYAAAGRALPSNSGPRPDLKRRELDCLVINYCADRAPAPYQTVRGAFFEGAPAYPGAMIRRESHIQIAVRDVSCILGVFRPNLG